MTRTLRQALLSFALVATLSLSMGAAWAQQTQPPAPANRPHPLAGSIASVSDGTFVLTSRDGRSITVRTTTSTRVLGRQPATLADIREGDTVRVLATKAADGTLTARAVQDVPAALRPPTAQARDGVRQGRDNAVMVAGTVVGNPAAGTLTIASPNGQNTSVAIPAAARLSRLVSVPISNLTAGARVLVQGTPNADGSVTASVVFVPGMPGK